MTIDYYGVAREFEDKIQFYGNSIFKDIYPCRVRAVDMRSTEDIAMRGFNTTGDERYDQQMREELIDCYITVNHMVEYYRKSVNVYLQVPDHSKIIFDVVTNYLNAWMDVIRYTHIDLTPPTDDLILLNNFSKMIYPVAKPALEFNPGDGIDAALRKFNLFKDPNKREANAVSLPDDYHGHTKQLAELMVRQDRISRISRKAS